MLHRKVTAHSNKVVMVNVADLGNEAVSVLASTCIQMCT